MTNIKKSLFCQHLLVINKFYSTFLFKKEEKKMLVKYLKTLNNIRFITKNISIPKYY